MAVDTGTDGDDNMLSTAMSASDLPGAEHGHAGGEQQHGRRRDRRANPAIELRPPSQLDVGDARHDARLELVPIGVARRGGVQRAEPAHHLVVVVWNAAENPS